MLRGCVLNLSSRQKPRKILRAGNCKVPASPLLEASMNTISWNAHYRAFRGELDNALTAHRGKLVYAREAFLKVAKRFIYDVKDTPEFRRAVRTLLREIGIVAVIGKKYVVLSKSTAPIEKPVEVPVVQEPPRCCMHSAQTLLDIMLRPTLTFKRRWMLNFTYALWVDDDCAVFLDQPIDNNDRISITTLIFERGEVLFVNDSALQIIRTAFTNTSYDLQVRKL